MHLVKGNVWSFWKVSVQKSQALIPPAIEYAVCQACEIIGLHYDFGSHLLNASLLSVGKAHIWRSVVAPEISLSLSLPDTHTHTHITAACVNSGRKCADFKEKSVYGKMTVLQ